MEEQLKKAAELTEQEFNQKKVDKQVEKIKALVQATLEEIDLLQKEKEEIEKEIKLLRTDLEDMREGRLDRIKERQEKDSKAKEVSVIRIIEKEVSRDPYYPYYPWNRPYYVYEQLPYDTSITYCSDGTGGVAITGKLTQTYSAGAYNINGHVVNFR